MLKELWRKPIPRGVIIGEGAAFLAAAFCYADLFWFSDILSWPVGSRFMFLYMAISAGFLGGIVNHMRHLNSPSRGDSPSNGR